MIVTLLFSAVALALGVLGAWRSVPVALETGHGELSLIAAPMTAWALWLGRKYGRPGPGSIPQAWWAAAIVAAAAAAALLVDASWVAALAVAPAALFAARVLLPALATPRVLILLYLAPLSYALDQYVGLELRHATAAGAGWVAGLLDPENGARIADEISCGPHTIAVTPACSGARLAVRMLALASILCMLKPPPLRQGVYMHLAALAFAAVANVGRIAALCHAAPGYTADQMDSLETYHDVSGIVAFIAAYALLGWLNARWTRVPAEPVTRG